MTAGELRWTTAPDGSFGLAGRETVPAAAQEFLDFRLDVAPDHLESALDFGTWWALPFARDEFDALFAVRLVPGTPLAASPVVRLVGAEGITVVSRAAALIPDLLRQHALYDDGGWTAVLGLEGDLLEGLSAMHRLLGGVDELAGVLGHLRSASRSALRERDADGRCAVDAAPATRVFRSWVETLRAGLEPPVVPAGVDDWRKAAVSLVYEVARRHDDLAVAAVAAWEMLAMPGLDSCHQYVTQHPTTDGARAAPRAIEAASLLVETPAAVRRWRGDPAWVAIEAVAAERERYRGAQHRAAALALAQTDPERAWELLAGAAYWAGAGEDCAPIEDLETARALAASSGWAEIVAALDVLRPFHVPPGEDDGTPDPWEEYRETSRRFWDSPAGREFSDGLDEAP